MMNLQVRMNDLHHLKPHTRAQISHTVTSIFAGIVLGEEERVMGVEQLVKVSRQYRSIMKDCQEQLELLAETGMASESGHYIAQSDLLYKLELIWHLVEILFLDTTPGGLVLPHLLHWVSLHFPGCEERARSVLSQGSEEPEQHAKYREAVVKFVLQGRVEQARNLSSDGATGRWRW